MSISGPYVLVPSNSSGAAYSGDPQCVLSGSSSLYTLLKPKSTRKSNVCSDEINKQGCIVKAFYEAETVTYC